MLVYTDAPDYARSLFTDDDPGAPGAPGAAGVRGGRGGAARVNGACGPAPDPAVADLVSDFFPRPRSFHVPTPGGSLWRYALVSAFAAESQYDRVIRLGREGVPLPDGVVCVARAGGGFRGFHGRSWSGHPGNIHLTVHLAPGRPMERFESVFMALAAVSVVETLDGLPGLAGRAGIRWVNDVVVGEAKAAGVLAHTQTRGATVTSAVLGIGVNVEATPAVRPTAFVPSVTSVAEVGADPAAAQVGRVLRRLLRTLEGNYRLLLAEGYRPLVDRYRSRSVVLGRDVVISADHPDERPRPVAAGRVTAVGDGLELRLAGRDAPVTRGRLILPAARAADPNPLQRAS